MGVGFRAGGEGGEGGELGFDRGALGGHTRNWLGQYYTTDYFNIRCQLSHAVAVWGAAIGGVVLGPCCSQYSASGAALSQ